MLKPMLTIVCSALAIAVLRQPAWSAPDPESAGNSMAACKSEVPSDAIPACTVIIENASTTNPEKASAYALRAQAFTALAFDQDAKNAEDWRDCIAGEPDPGLAACTRIIDNATIESSRRADALYNRSKRLLDKGQNAEAMADFQRSLKPFTDQKPESRKLAIADYSSAIELDPANSKSLAARGQLYLAYDDRQSALADFEKALAADSKEGMARLGRALLRDASGDPVGAVGDLKAILALPNDTDEAKWLHQTASELMSKIGAD
jgi:tetratricopeptide (TPR) repeat protein